MNQVIDTNTLNALKQGGWDTSNLQSSDEVKTQDSTSQQAIQSGADPQNLAWAKAHMNAKDYAGYCQQFVDDAMGVPYPRTGRETAFSAWNNAQNKVQDSSLKGAKPGDLVYFSPNQSNKNEGHTGIYQGNGQFISATDNGVIPSDVNSWNQENGTSILGYIPSSENQTPISSPTPNPVPTPTAPPTAPIGQNSNAYNNLPPPTTTGLPQIRPLQNGQPTGLNINPLSPNLQSLSNSIYVPRRYEYR